MFGIGASVLASETDFIEGLHRLGKYGPREVERNLPVLSFRHACCARSTQTNPWAEIVDENEPIGKVRLQSSGEYAHNLIQPYGARCVD